MNIKIRKQPNKLSIPYLVLLSFSECMKWCVWRPGPPCPSSATHTSAQWTTGREPQGVGPRPSQLGIFLRSFQKHDSHIWIRAEVE